jgi:hypothetical protein
MDENSIKDWCDELNITNYRINEDGTVDVSNNGVGLYQIDIDIIPIQFGIVGGYFNCTFNRLKSLDGSPRKVFGEFFCDYNDLTSLKGSPDWIDGVFSCTYNTLKSLEGGPGKVRSDYICSNNMIDTLEFMPSVVHGKFDCSDNPIYKSYLRSIKLKSLTI